MKENLLSVEYARATRSCTALTIGIKRFVDDLRTVCDEYFGTSCQKATRAKMEFPQISVQEIGDIQSKCLPSQYQRYPQRQLLEGDIK